ncbi:DUF1622 domain-containing protein [Clostridium massiliamazoniense]|uniref:DUF1622 domain-containing protein n=1 Tax=Clostridium massiliamazoniense TaxID=1347366 RepID=UPI000A03AC68|nr:DUF1622 domain-containing protein [Clostridium massiliamazoniense]
MGELIKIIIPEIIHLLELFGITIIAIGGLRAFYKYLMNLLMKKNYSIKIDFAESLTLALEFKLGAEILKTVLVQNLDEMYILGAVILLRAVLAFVIHWEVKGERKLEGEKKLEEARKLEEEKKKQYIIEEV